MQSLAFVRDETTIASATMDGAIRLWSAADGSPRGLLVGHRNGIWGISASPDGRALASASSDETVKLWNIGSGQSRLDFVTSVLPGTVATMAFTPDSKSLVTAHGVGKHIIEDSGNYGYYFDDAKLTFTTWNAKTGAVRSTLRAGPTRDIRALELSEDGTTAGITERDWSITFWETSGGGVPFYTHPPRRWEEFWMLRGRKFAIIPGHGPVEVWNAGTGRRLQALAATVPVCFDFRRNAIFARSDSVIRSWDFESGERRSDHPGFGNWGAPMSVSPDTFLVAWVDSGMNLWLRDMDALQSPVLLLGPKEPVSSLAFSPDGKTLAVGYPSGVVRLWDTATGGELLALEGPAINPVVRFAADGSALAIMRGHRSASP